MKHKIARGRCCYQCHVYNSYLRCCDVRGANGLQQLLHLLKLHQGQRVPFYQLGAIRSVVGLPARNLRLCNGRRRLHYDVIDSQFQSSPDVRMQGVGCDSDHVFDRAVLAEADEGMRGERYSMSMVGLPVCKRCGCCCVAVQQHRNDPGAVGGTVLDAVILTFEIGRRGHNAIRRHAAENSPQCNL